MSDRRDHDRLEDRLETWLAGLPDLPPDGLAGEAAVRARSKRQRPAWLATVRQRSGFAGTGRGPVPVLVATLAVVALIVIAVPFVGRQLSGPGVTPPAPTSTAPPATPTTAPPASPSPASPSPSGPQPVEDAATRSLPLATVPSAVGNAFGSLWVADLEGTLVRLDPATGAEQARIPLGAPGCGPIQADAHALWLATCGAPGAADATASTTIRVNPTTNEVVNRYEDDEPDGVGIATLSGEVWFISGPRELTAVGAETGGLLRRIEVERPIRHLTGGFGSLWVTPIGEARVSRVAPADGAEIASIPLSGASGFITVTGDAIWVSEPHQWLFARIDPTTNAAAGEYIGAPVADQIVADGQGRVWVLAHEELIAFDPRTGAEVGRFAVPLHDTVGTVEALVLAADADGVWYGGSDALWFVPSPSG